jgi:hypothetical protein
MKKKKIKFSSRSYMQPTPKNLKRLGVGLLGFGSILTTFAISKNIEWLAYVSVGFTAIATFIVDFFGEEDKK